MHNAIESVGIQLCRKWDLPFRLCDVVLCHRLPKDYQTRRAECSRRDIPRKRSARTE